MRIKFVRFTLLTTVVLTLGLVMPVAAGAAPDLPGVEVAAGPSINGNG